MDYLQEQEMEIEALQAILMDDIQEAEQVDGMDESQGPFYQISISPEDDDEEESSLPFSAAQVALIFAHTPHYPDEPPILDVRGVKGVRDSEARELKEKLQAEALENIGMSMIYTLVSSAKEWLIARFKQGGSESVSDEEVASGIDEVVEPHGELVTTETFLAWRERFEAELALERARLMPDSALTVSKDKRLTGRAWFESGRASAVKAGKPVTQSSDEEAEEEDIDFDADYDDGDVDEDDMLEHYLCQKSEKV